MTTCLGAQSTVISSPAAALKAVKLSGYFQPSIFFHFPVYKTLAMDCIISIAVLLSYQKVLLKAVALQSLYNA